MGKFSFRKAERLNKEKDIQELFEKGSSFYLFPFKVLVLTPSGSSPVFHQVLISVSKRNFKTAVERNRIKRQIREAYRLAKNLLPSASRKRIALIYTHKEILSYREISMKMVHVCRRITRVSNDLPGIS